MSELNGKKSKIYRGGARNTRRGVLGACILTEQVLKRLSLGFLIAFDHCLRYTVPENIFEKKLVTVEGKHTHIRVI